MKLICLLGVHSPEVRVAPFHAIVLTRCKCCGVSLRVDPRRNMREGVACEVDVAGMNE